MTDGGVFRCGLWLARPRIRQQCEHQSTDGSDDDECRDDDGSGDSVWAPQPRQRPLVETLATATCAEFSSVRRYLFGELTCIVRDRNGKRALATGTGTIRLRWSVITS